MLQSQMHSAAATRTAAALLRQLAGSDAIKAELIEAGIFDLITRCAREDCAMTAGKKRVHAPMYHRSADLKPHERHEELQLAMQGVQSLPLT